MSSNAQLTRRAWLAFAVASVPLAALPGVARAGSSDDALKSVADARASLKTLVAKFTQVRKVGLLADEVTSTGELTIVMPDQLRWELFAPDDIVYWVSSKGVAYKTKNSKKATTAPAGAFGSILPDLIAFLGGDLAKLKSRYEITATPESDGSVSMVAKPTDAKIKEHLKKLSMRTNAEKWGIASVVIEEPKGDSSSITFQANQKNVKVDADRMKPPA
ncbi:MAG: outer membrane lipoprotein carrier protein LolA [Polyangiaceae bacterium]|nr:outer membrane lipoprotein carrier protein LolA [Polyangiaceae bacterium]